MYAEDTKKEIMQILHLSSKNNDDIFLIDTQIEV